MAKGDQPLKVAAEQNIRATLWENVKANNDGTYKSVTITTTRVKKEAKEKPKEERTNEDYIQQKINLGYSQVEVLKRLLEQLTKE